ncbi:hypothetical protein DY218_03015 [Streptomyces triticagri]|uniref:Integral membrane protein n=1 Tax=Streptomyces triticagri TaxID=2293568 RepID=A0A372MB27_9ACTN|nr:hypothetical protein [Streptomyces triticagri]RFU88101.1 hypothetical protein DY218_03015 [Streptomyces triticagri]
MRATRTLAVTAVAGAFIGLAAPAASAWDGSTISVSPSTVARGGTASVTVNAHECANGSGKVSSDAFPTTHLRPKGGGGVANVTIHHNATPGVHSVTATCGGQSVTRDAALTVIHGGVRGGLGGSSSTGATATDIAIGGGLVTAALVGGGVFWMRRRGESKA